MLPEANLFLQTAWIAEEQIRSYTIFSINNQMMEQWAFEVLAILRHWPAEKPIRLLYDLSHPNVSMSYFVLSRRDLFKLGVTETGQAEAERFLARHPDRQIKLAVVLSNTMLGTLSKYVPNADKEDNFQAKVFFKPELAHKWLLASYDAPEVSTMATLEEALLSLEPFDVDDLDIYGDRNYLRLLVNGSLEIVPISETAPVIIGRHSDATLDLRSYGEDARNVSRSHAQISLVNGRLSILDLNSRNGTLVSGRQIEAGKVHFIRRDETINVGNISISIIF